MDKKRWTVTIFYKLTTYPDVVEIEELEELQDIVEDGPDMKKTLLIKLM